ncbi:hypothetical protein EON63_00210 [archaeon]|nr:MAG: hypothetical protein EON63_00210 [archaeon]
MTLEGAVRILAKGPKIAEITMGDCTKGGVIIAGEILILDLAVELALAEDLDLIVQKMRRGILKERRVI